MSKTWKWSWLTRPRPRPGSLARPRPRPRLSYLKKMKKLLKSTFFEKKKTDTEVVPITTHNYVSLNHGQTSHVDEGWKNFQIFVVIFTIQ